MNRQELRDIVFLRMAREVAKLSNCRSRQVGAILTRDNMIISTGYNGTPKGVKNCFDGGCERCASEVESGMGLSDCICVHAEENAIVQAAYNGVATADSILYCTHKPCKTCLKTLINAGVMEVFYVFDYPVDYGLHLRDRIEMEQYPEESLDAI